MSVMMDHYRSKKRRRCLVSKTPPMKTKQLKENNSQEGSPFCMIEMNSHNLDESKGIPRPKKKQRKISPSISISSDESSLEINWDNNSPTPSQASKTKKSARTNSKNICKLLKPVPKKRRSVDVNESDREIFLNTWMQNSLAPCSLMVDDSAQKPVTRRSSSAKRTVSSRGDILNFNEEIKKFLGQINSDSVEKNEDLADQRVSRLNVSRKNASPSYFSNSETDSLLNFESSSDSIVADLDTMSLRRTPMRACRARAKIPQPICKTTPRAASIDKRSIPSIPSNSISKETKTKVRARLRLTKRRSMSSNPSLNTIQEAEYGESPSYHDGGAIQTAIVCAKLDVDFEDDELDEILLTQPEELTDQQPKKTDNEINDDSIDGQRYIIDKDMESIENNNNNNNDDDDDDESFTKIQSIFHKNIRKNMSTPKSTVKIRDDIFGVDNDNGDDKMFDDILANFSDDDFKCKSQEAVKRLTSDQRKLKRRCHTSPLPLQINYDNSKNQVPFGTKEVIPVVKKLKNIQCNKISSKENTLRCMKPTANNLEKPVSCTGESSASNPSGSAHRSFISPGMVTTACRKPFVPPKKNGVENTQNYSVIRRRPANGLATQRANSSSYSDPSSKLLPIDLSAIMNTRDSNVSMVDVTFDSTNAGSTDNKIKIQPFNSTQKCSMTEIEVKRRCAQMKLRERLQKSSK